MDINNILVGKAKEDFNGWLIMTHYVNSKSTIQYPILIEWLDSIGIHVGVFAGTDSQFNWNIQVRGTWKKWMNGKSHITRYDAYYDLLTKVVDLYNDGQLIEMPLVIQEVGTLVECECRKPDIKYLGIPNICFSLTDKDDKREKAYAQQRRDRGFDDSETWSLSGTLSNFLLPRLKRFNELDNTERDEKYQKDMENFIALLELESRDEGTWDFTKEEEKQINKGLKAFKRIFFRLWW